MIQHHPSRLDYSSTRANRRRIRLSLILYFGTIVSVIGVVFIALQSHITKAPTAGILQSMRADYVGVTNVSARQVSDFDRAAGAILSNQKRLEEELHTTRPIALICLSLSAFATGLSGFVLSRRDHYEIA